ncbi:hypothetical protein AMS68_004487 [Peltaster fructicola]|uniref:Mitochondrial carrier protein n=1 Tax=Peltaster fructicola TaxID=286661 RepID=A0A6H0XX12_9PEZI|nr:hypothetical protein AMS68_004487 [Peltaster fructicola]
MLPDPILTPDIREGLTRQHKSDHKKRKDNATTGLSAAGLRAVSARFVSFYFRAPIKAFFRTRVDYMGYVRAVNPNIKPGDPWSWRMTSPVLLAEAVRRYGFRFIPEQVLPPLLANATVGAVLYTAYLQTLGAIHEPSGRGSKRVYPPPSLQTTATAGFVAGSVQSLVAAPLDALQVRFQSAELLNHKYKNMWVYAWRKVHEIGARGVFAGYSLSFLKDSLGCALFFGSFEYIKSQCFYSFVSNFYSHYATLSAAQKEEINAQSSIYSNPVIRPHYMIEPSFILVAGVTASVAQQAVQHPIGRVQDTHYGRLEYIDTHVHKKPGQAKINVMRLYANAYRKTLKQVYVHARRAGSLRKWLYRDFFMSTLKQVPSTSVGLIVFEVVRRKYSTDEDAVRIEKDGYDILLP